MNLDKEIEDHVAKYGKEIFVMVIEDNKIDKNQNR